jgi:GAF domain-containing protein
MQTAQREYASAAITTFGRMASAVVAGRGRNEVLDLLAASARQLLRADVATVALRGSDGDVQIVATVGAEAEAYRGTRFPPEGTSTDHVLRTGEPIVVRDISDDPVVGPRLNGAPIGPIVFVPISVDGPYGVLSVGRLRGGAVFDNDDVAVLQTLADQAALVLELDCHRRRAADRDRLAAGSRVAADLQERAVSEVFAATLTLSQLANSVSDASQRELVVQAIDALDRAIKQIRQSALSGLLEPSRNS